MENEWGTVLIISGIFGFICVVTYLVKLVDKKLKESEEKKENLKREISLIKQKNGTLATNNNRHSSDSIHRMGCMDK